MPFGPRPSDPGEELLDRLQKAPSPVDENKLGILYAQFGLLPKALERFESAIATKPYLPAMVNAANVYTIQQDFGRALDYLKRAQELEPDNARVLIALAFSLLRSGSTSDARNTFERASKIDPPLAFRYPLSGATASSTGSGRAADAAAAPGASATIGSSNPRRRSAQPPWAALLGGGGVEPPAGLCGRSWPVRAVVTSLTFPLHTQYRSFKARPSPSDTYSDGENDKCPKQPSNPSPSSIHATLKS